MRSRALGRASSEVASLAAPRDARRRAMGEATAAARVRPTRVLRATAGLRRPAPRRAARAPSVPGFQSAGLPPAPALPARRSRPPRSQPGRGTEKLESWEPRESANARQDPRFPDSQLADSRSLPATAAAGLRLAGAVIALASRPITPAPDRMPLHWPRHGGRRVTDTPAGRAGRGFSHPLRQINQRVPRKAVA